MSLILAIARVQVCVNCGAHAQVIFSDGSRTPHFGTMKRGLAYLEAARASDLITAFEYPLLFDGVLATDLPFESAETDQFIEEYHNRSLGRPQIKTLFDLLELIVEFHELFGDHSEVMEPSFSDFGGMGREERRLVLH